MVSVALSVASLRLGVTQHPALWSPDFPPRRCRSGRPALLTYPSIRRPERPHPAPQYPLPEEDLCIIPSHTPRPANAHPSPLPPSGEGARSPRPHRPVVQRARGGEVPACAGTTELCPPQYCSSRFEGRGKPQRGSCLRRNDGAMPPQNCSSRFEGRGEPQRGSCLRRNDGAMPPQNCSSRFEGRGEPQRGSCLRRNDGATPPQYCSSRFEGRGEPQRGSCLRRNDGGP